MAPGPHRLKPPQPKTNGRDQFFDQWLVARSERLRRITELALAMLDHADAYTGRRRRKRRDEDDKTRKALVETVIANLAYVSVNTLDPSTIAVSLSTGKHVTRYDRAIFRQLPRTLADLQKADFLVLLKSQHQGRLSTIQPTPWFSEKVTDDRVGLEDFAWHPDEELVVLTASRWDFKTDQATNATTFGKQRRWIDYTHDTAETRRYRNEMRTINAFLADADLGFVSDEGPRPDTNRRRLRRYFRLPDGCPEDQPRFDEGGRLFGGWWEDLAKTERHGIRIDGEPIADIDYSGMFPRLAYLRLGTEPPEGDIYSVPGLEAAEWRDGVKGMMNTLFFATDPKLRIPSEIKDDLPKGWNAAMVKAAILTKHPALAPLFETGAGMGFMFTESQILVAVLLRLIGEGITALPMHDGLMVARANGDKARAAMEETAERLVGKRLPALEKPLKRSLPGG